MGKHRSYLGCLTCRKRKLKCDEVKPFCGQCKKSARECVFKERAIFRNVDYQSLLSPREKRRDGPSGEDDTSVDDDHVWVDVPTELTFINIDDPYDVDDDNIPIQGEPEDHAHTATFTSPVDRIELQPHHEQFLTASPGHGSFLAPSINEVDTSSSTNNGEQDTHENLVALRLLRHFKDGPGQWMDVLDTGAYFSQRVPVMANTKPLLKSAACALSAKHLDHLQINLGVQTEEPFYRRPFVSSSRHQNPDWQYQAAKYYDRAICHLKDAIEIGGFDGDVAAKDQIFAAIAILCTYELMDAPGTAWRAHLSALPLFNPAPEHDSAHSPVAIPRANITGPVFWSLARQDLLCAFISERRMRLDPKDIRLWRNAGLATDVDGFLIPISQSDVHTAADVEEDTRSNELTWLLGKIANIITSGDALVPENYALPPGQRPLVGVTQEILMERWSIVARELQQWRRSLPESFTPSARTPVEGLNESTDDNYFPRFEQIWYETPICSATAQNYHMACILMLVNQPHESTAVRSSVSARLNSYRESETEALWHARELCGISLADPPDSVRIHSVQPLSVAGQVFYENKDLEVVYELLIGIERDLGWTTSYHTSRLSDLLQGKGNRLERQRRVFY